MSGFSPVLPTALAPGDSRDRTPRPGEAFERLLSLIRERAARVGIIGLGYVGLPLARAFTAKGYPVLGFDVDRTKVARLRQGKSYIGHISDATLREMAAGGFEATDQFERLSEA